MTINLFCGVGTLSQWWWFGSVLSGDLIAGNGLAYGVSGLFEGDGEPVIGDNAVIRKSFQSFFDKKESPNLRISASGNEKDSGFDSYLLDYSMNSSTSIHNLSSNFYIGDETNDAHSIILNMQNSPNKLYSDSDISISSIERSFQLGNDWVVIDDHTNMESSCYGLQFWKIIWHFRKLKSLGKSFKNS